MLPDIGLGELLVIALVVLMVAKPEDIPHIMRRLGIITAHVRSYLSGMVMGWRENLGIK